MAHKRIALLVVVGAILLCTRSCIALAFGGQSFVISPKVDITKPQLILIGGPTGTGKSNFGMQVALSQGVSRCVSTDAIRGVMRNFVSKEISPALHRSSYAGEGDTLSNWRECCAVLEGSIESLVRFAMEKGVSLVVEGVHLVPSNKLLDQWKHAGGTAVGVLLTIPDSQSHENLMLRRLGEEKNLKAYVGRIRSIQDEMIRLAEGSEWLMIEQKFEPQPLDIVASLLLDPKSGIKSKSSIDIGAKSVLDVVAEKVNSSSGKRNYSPFNASWKQNKAAVTEKTVTEKAVTKKGNYSPFNSNWKQAAAPEKAAADEALRIAEQEAVRVAFVSGFVAAEKIAAEKGKYSPFNASWKQNKSAVTEKAVTEKAVTKKGNFSPFNSNWKQAAAPEKTSAYETQYKAAVTEKTVTKKGNFSPFNSNWKQAAPGEASRIAPEKASAYDNTSWKQTKSSVPKTGNFSPFNSNWKQAGPGEASRIAPGKAAADEASRIAAEKAAKEEASRVAAQKAAAGAKPSYGAFNSSWKQNAENAVHTLMDLLKIH